MKKNIIRTALLLFNLGFFKYILFKLKCLLPENIKILKFKNQKFYIRKNTSDFEVFRQVFASKQYNVKGLSGEQVEYIIDLGSNNGMSAAQFKMQFPKAKLIGVDPDLDNIAIAKKILNYFLMLFLSIKQYGMRKQIWIFLIPVKVHILIML